MQAEDSLTSTDQSEYHLEADVRERSMSKRPALHRRNYRACYLCRQKKIRCDLGDLNDPQPPCAKCKREKKQCVFIQGGTGRASRTGSARSTRSTDQQPRSAISRGQTHGTHQILPTATTDRETLSGVQAITSPAIEALSTPNRVSPPQATTRSLGERIEFDAPSSPSQGIIDTVVRDDSDALRLLFDATRRDELHTSVHSPQRATSPSQTYLPEQRPDTSVNPNPPRESARISTLEGGGAIPVVDNGVLQQLPKLTAEQMNHWRRFPSCSQGLVSPAEVVAYLNYFFTVLNVQMPILSNWFMNETNRTPLLAEESMLCYTILTVSSRYLLLPGHNGFSRGYLLHDHFFKYVQDGLQRLLWGVSSTTQTGTGLIGAIESIILLTQWQPRTLYPQIPSSEPLNTASASPRGTSEDVDESSDNSFVPAAAAMGLRSDMICWRLASLAVALSFEGGVFDLQHAISPTTSPCSGHDHRVPHLKQILHIYVAHLAQRLKRPNPLASVPRVKRDITITTEPSPEGHSSWSSILNIWLDLLDLGSVTSDMLNLISQSSTATASKERQDTIVRHLATTTSQWWRDFTALNIPQSFRLNMEVEYHYLRILIHSVGLQNRPNYFTGRSSQRPAVSGLDEGQDASLLQEVTRSCCAVYNIIIELQKLRALTSITAPLLLRLVTVSMFGLKVIAVSEVQDNNLMTLLDSAIVALRKSAVDDLHPSGYYASLLERLVRKARRRVSRNRPTTSHSHLMSQANNLSDRHLDSGNSVRDDFLPLVDYGNTSTSDQWDGWLAFQFDPTLAVIGDADLSNPFAHQSGFF